MFVVESKAGAIGCMLLSLLFLGTWPAFLTLLERRGRLPQHTYIDFSITNFLAAVFIALTFGQIGKSTPEEPKFLSQFSWDLWPSILFAMAGGVFLSLGNLATQYAWAFVGLSVTEVIACSMTVVIGTTLNYFLDDKINEAQILFPGVGCFLIAVCIGSAVHASNDCDNKAKLQKFSSNSKVPADVIKIAEEDFRTSRSFFFALISYATVSFMSFLIALHSYRTANTSNLQPISGEGNKLFETLKHPMIFHSGSQNVIFCLSVIIDAMKDLEIGKGGSEKAKVGTADYLIQLENKRAIKVLGKGTLIGLAITFFAGTSLSLFSPAINIAINDQWHTLKEGVPHLIVYSAFFYFSLSCFAIAIILNITFLYHPALNLPRSSIETYLKDCNGRGWALLAGLLAGFGNGLQFAGGQAAGFAAADAVQALPLVSTFWGMVLFGEYRRSSRRTYALLVSMLLMFVVAVAILLASSGHRK